ncbi:MAG TPA: uroporphyrinogen decarboxylase family protein [Clostridia bacterium]|nr:uroporphyrinogen decarboxylase family protein [Clostridia bacterium]
MENKAKFRCEGENLEQIPEAVAAKTGVTFPGAHKDRKQMALLAKELKAYKQDSVVRIPFCVTVEAEALGGDIQLGDERIGPRVRGYSFESLEEMRHMKEIDLENGRIGEVLECIPLLAGQGETVALSVEGPFTIISSLIDPMSFYKGLRKNREAAAKIIASVEDSIVKYIREGLKRGARIISYGDPVGAMDIVGPKLYAEVSGRSSYNILKRIEPQLEAAAVHICGKTSTAFEELGWAETVPVEFPEGIKYGEAINKVLEERKDVKFIGHSCIKRSPFLLGGRVLWGIKLLADAETKEFTKC